MALIPATALTQPDLPGGRGVAGARFVPERHDRPGHLFTWPTLPWLHSPSGTGAAKPCAATSQFPFVGRGRFAASLTMGAGPIGLAAGFACIGRAGSLCLAHSSKKPRCSARLVLRFLHDLCGCDLVDLRGHAHWNASQNGCGMWPNWFPGYQVQYPPWRWSWALPARVAWLGLYVGARRDTAMRPKARCCQPVAWPLCWLAALTWLPVLDQARSYRPPLSRVQRASEVHPCQAHQWPLDWA